LKDLDKSLAAQKSLLQQQQELEAESAEMQDFLQEEKATLADALKDAELEVRFLFFNLLLEEYLSYLFSAAQEKRRNFTSERGGFSKTNG